MEERSFCISIKCHSAQILFVVGSEEKLNNIVYCRSKLPVPNLSKVAVVPSDSHEDNAVLHEGRKRSFPHVRGNWATFVYVNCKGVFLIISYIIHHRYSDNINLPIYFFYRPCRLIIRLNC